ncbi:MAG: fimbrillin family protein, partial [Tannerellaceae bacterium]
MRHNRLTAVIFACTIALVACSNDEEISKDLENKTGDELVISAGLETSVVTDAKGRSTKASLPAVGSVTAFTNQEFTLIVKENRTGEDQGKSLTVATAKTDATLTGTPIGVHDNQVDPAKAALTPKLYWDDLGGKLANINLVGIHPTTANPGLKTDNIIWEVQSDQSSGSTASDLMLAYRPAYTYSDKSTAANLNFN